MSSHMGSTDNVESDEEGLLVLEETIVRLSVVLIVTLSPAMLGGGEGVGGIMMISSELLSWLWILSMAP